MIYHSVYGEIVAGWKWSGGVLNVASFLFFAGVILWHLVRIRRQRRALQELRSSLPPIRTEWIELAQTSSEEDTITLAPLSAAAQREDDSSSPHTDDFTPTTQLQATRTAHKRLPFILLHISFALFMASLAFWPWAHVAFDLLDFYRGLLSLWAIVVVAWTVASGPSLFHALLHVYPDAQAVPDEPFLATEEGGRTRFAPPLSSLARSYSTTTPSETMKTRLETHSPSTASRRGAAGIPAAAYAMPSKCKDLFQCLWTYSLQEKLTGVPPYEVLKGDKDLKIKRQWYQTRWGRLLTFYGGLLVLLLASWFLLYASASLCITDHPVSFSSRFTRSFSSPVCGVKNGTLCHVYVMPPYDGAHEMIVNLVLLGSLGQAPVQIHYDTTPKGEASRKDYQYVTSASTVVELPLPVGEGPRYAQAVLLSKLEPNTVYHFVVSVASGAEVSAPFSFRTLPAYGEVPIVVGGDSSVEPIFAQLLDVVGTRDVRLVMVAGDVAYANGMRSCYRRWDDWLATWHAHMKTAEGHLMPLITSIGNHDVGPGGFGTYWSGLFVQSKQALGAPRWQDRQTFHAHTIANHTLLMVLDTGHVTQAADQVTWMQNVFANNADLPNKLAAYHIPLYPSRRSYDDAINIDLRKHWLPVFDQNELDVGFEHHDHSYKRSKRLRAGQFHQNGTLYLGDGCFGVPRKEPDASRPYLEKAEAIEHGFFVSIQERHVEIEAFDTTGHIFDHATVL